MGAKVKELDNTKHGDRRQCPICNPRFDRVPMDQLWAWSLAHPNEKPLR